MQWGLARTREILYRRFKEVCGERVTVFGIDRDKVRTPKVSVVRSKVGVGLVDIERHPNEHAIVVQLDVPTLQCGFEPPAPGAYH